MKIVYNLVNSQRTKKKEIKIINNNIQSNIHMIRHNIFEQLIKIKNKNIIRILSYLIITNLFFLSFSKESYITLKIYGKGFQNVFFESHPSDIFPQALTYKPSLSQASKNRTNSFSGPLPCTPLYWISDREKQLFRQSWCHEA